MAKRLSNGIRLGVFTSLCDMHTADPARIARTAEALGFDSYWVPEHQAIPEGSADDYPAATPGEPPPEYLFKMPDPFIALSRAAAVTSDIRLGTGIALVPERNPILAAKEIASVDHYSGGRMLYGIGAGWNEPECTLMGGDFERRWTQTTEAIEVMKKLWTGEYVEHHGKYFDFPRVVCLPAPASRPHPPVLLGSIGSPRVFRRVAKWGNGWIPVTDDPKEIAAGKAEILRHAEEFGRSADEFEIILFSSPFVTDRNKDWVAEAAQSGADTFVLWMHGQNADEIEAELNDLAGRLFD